MDQILPIKKSQSPEDRAKVIESAFDWCRNHSILPLDQRLPNKKSQCPEEKAMDIESAFDWCRNHSMLPLDAGSLLGFNKIGSITVSTRSPEDRRKDVEECLNWLRAGKPDDHDMADEFQKIVSLLPTKI